MPAQPGEDTLKREAFARNLARSLITEDGRSRGTVLGLTGSWGTGKSSVLNFVEAHVRTISEAPGYNGPPVIVLRFDPWILGATADLIEQFFHDLSAAIRIAAADKTMEKTRADQLKSVSKKVWGYGRSATINLAAIAGNFAGINAALARETLDKYIPGESASDTSLHVRREALRADIKESGISIIVLIDELDRVEDADVRGVAQLVKSVADFETISYLLAYDRTRVIEALGDKNSARGAAYLEKIVQFEVGLPRVTNAQLRETAIELLEGLLSSGMIHFPPVRGDTRAGEILTTAVRPGIIDSPRAVKRWIGAFAAVEPMLRGEVLPADLLGWTALSIADPELAEGILKAAVEQAETGYLAGAVSMITSDADRNRDVDVEPLIEIGQTKHTGHKVPFAIRDMLEVLFTPTKGHVDRVQDAWVEGRVDPRCLLLPRSLAMIANHGPYPGIPTFSDIRARLDTPPDAIFACRSNSGFGRALSDALIWDEELHVRDPAAFWPPLLDATRQLAAAEDIETRLLAQWIAPDVLGRALVRRLVDGTLQASKFRAICEADRPNGASDVLAHVLACFAEGTRLHEGLHIEAGMSLINTRDEMGDAIRGQIDAGRVLDQCALCDWIRIIDRDVEHLEAARNLLEENGNFLRFGAAVFGRMAPRTAQEDMAYLRETFGRDWLAARHERLEIDFKAWLGACKDGTWEHEIARTWRQLAKDELGIDMLLDPMRKKAGSGESED